MTHGITRRHRYLSSQLLLLVRLPAEFYFYYLLTPIGKVWIYRLLFVCFLFACTVTDFSGEDKARGVKFCTVVHRRHGQGISIFEELCSPEAPPQAPSRTNRRIYRQKIR